MFTVLAFGLCAFVIETPPDHTSFLNSLPWTTPPLELGLWDAVSAG
jgi:hypothetical protein